MKEKIIKIILGVLLLSTLVFITERTPTGNMDSSPVPALYSEKNFFTNSIKAATSTPTTTLVTGIIVPHHLLAHELIADIYKRVANQKYEHIILVSPDHFYLGEAPISISNRDFDTVFGKITINQSTTKKLLSLPIVATSSLFYREHGIQAQLPYIKYYFPNADLTALVIKENAKQNEIDSVVEKLKRNLDQKTLIIQSTDFSHYLPEVEANKKDEETIKKLITEDQNLVIELKQPDNIDSAASQYLQTKLQKEFFASHPIVIDHRNSQYYTNKAIDRTTSYFTLLYIKQ